MVITEEERAYEKKFLRVFGRRIAVGRKSLGMTQADFAKKVGIAPSSVASIEIGRRWPHLTIIYGIADALGTEPHKLLEGIEDEIGWR